MSVLKGPKPYRVECNIPFAEPPNDVAPQMPDDGALFRYWCEEASYRPSRVAKALTHCLTPDEYRKALLGLMMTDKR